VIERDGLAAASTRAIAEEVGIAAGTLCNYFDNRRQLLVRALFRRMHVASAPLGDIPSHAGKDTVAGNLREFARLVGDILEQLVPLFAAAFSDAGLLVALRQELQVVRGRRPARSCPIRSRPTCSPSATSAASRPTPTAAPPPRCSSASATTAPSTACSAATRARRGRSTPSSTSSPTRSRRLARDAPGNRPQETAMLRRAQRHRPREAGRASRRGRQQLR